MSVSYKKKNMTFFKLVVVGDQHVGKTSLVNRYIYDTFSSSYAYTSGGDVHHKLVFINERPVHVEIVDTMGQTDFKSLIKSLYRNAHGIAIVYDVTSSRSFSDLDSWIEHIRKHMTNEPQFLIMGNKQDLEQHRKVETRQAQNKAAHLDIPVIEVSAMHNVNVAEAFNTLVREVWMQQQKRYPGGYQDADRMLERTTVSVSESPAERAICCGLC